MKESNEPEVFDPTKQAIDAEDPCERCGSKTYAHSKVSATTMKPMSCDQCPPKRTIVEVTRGSQAVE